MWRSILALVLLPALSAAQTEQTSTTPTTEEPKTALPAPVPPRGSAPALPTTAPTYKHYTLHDGIRRGKREEMAIQLAIAGRVTTPKSPVPGIVPLKLEMEPSEGLVYGEFRYPKAVAQKWKFHAAPMRMAQWPVIRFDVQAVREASLGARVLHGKLTFQTIPYDGSGLGPVQQLDVEIPITVVEHNAKVTKMRLPFPHTPVWVVVTLIVLSPLIIPLALIYYSLCAIEGPHNCPD